ncbi:hypothetical protein MMC25_001176 [Agyrium rufum]|nr:hypothetical protein [Agyrium rufum]
MDNPPNNAAVLDARRTAGKETLENIVQASNCKRFFFFGFEEKEEEEEEVEEEVEEGEEGNRKRNTAHKDLGW